jgi:DNA-binding protein HU-beta
MNKKGLVEAVMKATGIETKAASERAVDAVFDTIVKTMGRGEEVAITGFGTFRVAKRAAATPRPAKRSRSRLRSSRSSAPESFSRKQCCNC